MPTTIVDKTACELAGQDQEHALLPINPFTALQFHFGMLLGVDDLETGQGYPRGKIRLHNAWLHRDGVVWGFNVGFNDHNELTVDRGLALDAAGHELHLDRLACVDLGQWYVANKDKPEFTFTTQADGSRTFSVHVVARFKACLTRPVPAIVEPCAGVGQETAYSRVFETVELLLRPGLTPARDLGYHRLRVLFQIEADSDAYADVKVRREAIQALDAAAQPAAYLQALREYAALDAIDLKPQAATATEPASIFPEDPTEVVLADLDGVAVKAGADGTWSMVTPAPEPNVKVRRTLIATATIQELLCGPLMCCGAGAPPRPAPGPQAGPTIVDAKLAGKVITLKPSHALARGSVNAKAFSIQKLTDEGWTAVPIKSVTPHDDGTIAIDLKDAPREVVRLVARGTGATPLVSAHDYTPLGATGRTAKDDGNDFVMMFRKTRS